MTPRTKEAKKIIWSKFHKWLVATYPACKTINDISAKVANQYMTENYLNKSTSTYNCHRHSLAHMWKELATSSNLPANVWRSVSAPARKTAKQYRPFNDDEIKAILEHSTGFWHYASLISYYSALRESDIVFLQWSQINLNTKVLQLVARKVARYSKKVTVSIHKDLVEILQEIPHAEKYVFSDIVQDYKNFSFRHEFGEILKNCGIADNEDGIVGFHSWRVTSITRAKEAGISLDDIRKMAGHSKVAMTEHYDHSKGSKKINKLKSITKKENVK
jgi:integrase